MMKFLNQEQLDKLRTGLSRGSIELNKQMLKAHDRSIKGNIIELDATINALQELREYLNNLP